MNVKERINKIFASRSFYIIFSILASLTIWLYVSYIENPDVPVTVRGVKVEILNQDYVTDKGLVITAFDTETVSLRFTGKRNIVTQLTNQNISVTVDLAEIDTKGVFQLVNYIIVYPIDVNPSTFTVSRSGYIAITVDNLAKKEIPVRGTYDGGVAEGYQAEPIELTPTVITVSGPQDVLKKISYAWVPVHRENITKTVEDNLPFTLMDESGHEVLSDKLTFSQDTIKVVIPVVMTKDIPLTVNLTNGAGADETNTTYKITPSIVSISGDAETLNSYNQISLGTIDLSKFVSATTVTFPIVLPNNTTNLTGITEAIVTVNITGLDSIHLTTDNIQVVNVTPGYTASIITKSLDIVLRGKKEDLDKVKALFNEVPATIRIVADLTELGATTGTYRVLAKVNIDGDVTGVGPIGEYKVTVTITKD